VAVDVDVDVDVDVAATASSAPACPGIPGVAYQQTKMDCLVI
jgi:hypothetical protein